MSSSRYRAPAVQEALLWLPALAILLLISSQMGLNANFRYLLPAFPFVFISISRVGMSVDALSSCRRFLASPRAFLLMICGSAVLLSLTWNIISTARTRPHYLSYFNEVVGGPEHGSEHLVDSNVDWGQDLLFLKQWAENNQDKGTLGLAYYGDADPGVFGVKYHLAPYGPDAAWGRAPSGREGPQPGWYAVSVNFIAGLGYTGYDQDGRRVFVPRNAYTYFRYFTPVDRAGYSILIYFITPDEAVRVRQQLGLQPLKAE